MKRTCSTRPGTVHECMPVFMPAVYVGDSLKPGKPESADALVTELAGQSELVAMTLEFYPVSRRVNNARTAPADDPALIEPL